MFYVCGLHVLCIVHMLIIHLHNGKHDVGRGNHGCVRWNVYLSERFHVVTKLIIIHPSTNLYATLAQTTLLRMLTIVSMLPIGHHVPWFKFQIYEFYFFKNIFTMDLKSCTKMLEVQWWKLFLNRMLHWGIITKK